MVEETYVDYLMLGAIASFYLIGIYCLLKKGL